MENQKGLTIDALGHIDTWIFDLDNTLYPESSSIFPQINARMKSYMADLLAMTEAEADALRQTFYVKHGTTLNGLMQEYGADPKPFLDYVHAIDVSGIEAHPNLAVLLGALPGRCLIHTNGTTDHAVNVLTQMNLIEAFEGIFDIVASDYTPKPHSAAFDQFIKDHAINPKTAIMFEDKTENLEVPHALGMATVWVNEACGETFPPDEPHLHYTTANVPSFLTKVLDLR